VNDPDAYSDVMGRLRPTDREIDEVLSGRTPEGHPDLFALAVSLTELRDSLARMPTEPHRSAHVAASAEAACTSALSRAGSQPAPSPRRKRTMRPLARIALSALVLTALTTGLALAGVDLPGLPDQASAPESVPPGDSVQGEASLSNTAADVLATIEDRLDDLQSGTISGCEFGHAVATAAGADVSIECPDATAEGSPERGGTPGDASATGLQRAAEGRGNTPNTRGGSGGSTSDRSGNPGNTADDNPGTDRSP
jgi:hypothetical protein